MKPGWVFTAAPSNGVMLCMMQTNERLIAVETTLDDDIHETMVLMARHCQNKGDTGEVLTRNH